MTAVLQARPTIAEPVRWRFPAVARSQTPNGLQVLAVHLPGKPVISAALLLDLPVDTDPVGREGLAVLAARSLGEGTRSHDAGAFADALERLGASFQADAGYRGLTALLDVPVSRLDAGLALLAEAVVQPAFETADVQRVIARRLAQIEQQRSSPGSRADLEFTALRHAAGSRAAISDGGTRESVSALDAEQLAAGYRARAGAATATLIIAGDLAAVDVPGLAATAFADWPAGPAQPWTPTTPQLAGGHRAVIVDRPGSVQTQLLLGHPAADRRSPRWPAMSLVAHALGGTLTSRIDAVLREQKGYTYGIRSRFEARRRGASFTVSGSVESATTGPALHDLDEILRTAVTGGLTDPEHLAARDYLVGVSPMRWETPGSVVRQLTAVVGNDLPPTWIDEYLDGLRGADLVAVDAALREQVRPDELLVVAVGEPAMVAEPLRQLGFGEPTVISSGPDA